VNQARDAFLIDHLVPDVYHPPTKYEHRGRGLQVPGPSYQSAGNRVHVGHVDLCGLLCMRNSRRPQEERLVLGVVILVRGLND